MAIAGRPLATKATRDPAKACRRVNATCARTEPDLEELRPAAATGLGLAVSLAGAAVGPAAGSSTERMADISKDIDEEGILKTRSVRVATLVKFLCQ